MSSYEGDSSKRIIKIVILSIIAFVGLILFFGSWTVVSEGEKGVVLRQGKYERTLSPGFSMKMPLLEEVVIMETRIQKIEVEAQSASSDSQEVYTNVALQFFIQEDAVVDVYKKLQNQYRSRVIDSAIQDSVKAGTAKFNAESLIKNREEVKSEIESSLTQRLSEFGIQVDNIDIANFRFSDKFTAEIEAKVTAEQRALTAKNDLERIKFEAQQTIETAKATAESQRIQAESLKTQGGAELVKLKWIEAWQSGGAQVPKFVTGEDGSNFIMSINE